MSQFKKARPDKVLFTAHFNNQTIQCASHKTKSKKQIKEKKSTSKNNYELPKAETSSS